MEKASTKFKERKGLGRHWKLLEESKKNISEGHKGEKAYQWKGGKPKCLECGVTTTQYTSKRCRDCYKKTMKGETSPCFKNKLKTFLCKVCSTEFKSHHSRIYCSYKCVSIERIGKPLKEKAYNWIKDRTLLKDDHKDRGGQLHREWSINVKNRDKWTCRIADNNCDGKMVAHHILGWSGHPELRYSINNGITLCHAHHPRKRAEEKRLTPTFQGLVSVLK